MVELLKHRQTKGAATDMFYLTPPRHISTLPHYGLKSDIARGPESAVTGSPLLYRSLRRPILPRQGISAYEQRQRGSPHRLAII